MLGVTRVVLELVILRHCHDRLPDNTLQVENLSRIVAVSLFTMEHFQTQKRPTTRNPEATEKESPDVARRDFESIALHRCGRRTRLEEFRFD
jgi:hypothetical protein